MSAGFDEVTQLALTLPTELHEAWTREIASRVDDIVNGRVPTVSRDEVRAQLAADRAARQR